jgi:hypothetical protein
MFAEMHGQLYPGQFSSEFAVVVASFSGEEFSLFASQDDVRADREPSDDEPVDGWLKVKVLERDGDHVLIQRALDFGRLIIVPQAGARPERPG